MPWELLLFVAWAVLSSAGLLWVVAPPVFRTAREPLGLAAFRRLAGPVFDWLAWTLGYSLIFMALLFAVAKADRPMALAAGLLAHMGLGWAFARLQGIEAVSRRLLMTGTPPLQAAVTVLHRRARKEAP